MAQRLADALRLQMQQLHSQMEQRLAAEARRSQEEQRLAAEARRSQEEQRLAAEARRIASKPKRPQCQHGRRRTICKLCGGGSFCEHGQRRTRCKQCHGSGICEHFQHKYTCRLCQDDVDADFVTIDSVWRAPMLLKRRAQDEARTPLKLTNFSTLDSV